MAISSSAPSRLPDHAARPGLRAGARTASELAAHFAIRRSVFVEAQGLFEHDDRDERDDDPATLHAVGLAGDEVVGAVRLYPLDDDGLWKGDRLAVLPSERALRLGAMLVRFAVRTAGERGGRLMVARSRCPTCASSSASAGAATATRRRCSASRTSRWRSSSGSAAAQAGERRDVEVPDRRPLGAGLQVEPARVLELAADLAGQAALR